MVLLRSIDTSQVIIDVELPLAKTIRSATTYLEVDSGSYSTRTSSLCLGNSLESWIQLEWQALLQVSRDLLFNKCFSRQRMSDETRLPISVQEHVYYILTEL